MSAGGSELADQEADRKPAISSGSGFFIENQRIANRRPTWTAPEIDVDSTGGDVSRPEGNVDGTEDRCGRHRRPKWTAPEIDVDSTGGDVSGPETDVGTTGDRCRQHRRPMFPKADTIDRKSVV